MRSDRSGGGRRKAVGGQAGSPHLFEVLTDLLAPVLAVDVLDDVFPLVAVDVFEVVLELVEDLIPFLVAEVLVLAGAALAGRLFDLVIGGLMAASGGQRGHRGAVPCRHLILDRAAVAVAGTRDVGAVDHRTFKGGVIAVDTGVQHRDGHVLTARGLPCVFDPVVLEVVLGVAPGVGRGLRSVDHRRGRGQRSQQSSRRDHAGGLSDLCVHPSPLPADSAIPSNMSCSDAAATVTCPSVTRLMCSSTVAQIRAPEPITSTLPGCI